MSIKKTVVREVQIVYTPEGAVANEKRKPLQAILRNHGLTEVSYEGVSGIPELFLLEDWDGVIDFLKAIKEEKRRRDV